MCSPVCWRGLRSCSARHTPVERTYKEPCGANSQCTLRWHQLMSCKFGEWRVERWLWLTLWQACMHCMSKLAHVVMSEGRLGTFRQGQGRVMARSPGCGDDRCVRMTCGMCRKPIAADQARQQLR